MEAKWTTQKIMKQRAGGVPHKTKST
jgi:hypothetical protein